MFWVWNSSRGGAWVGIGSMLMGLFICMMLAAPGMRIGGFLPLLLIFFAPALLGMFSRSSTQARPYYNETGLPLSDEKPKRGGSLDEMMSLLDDDDIDDLRRRVKQRLMEQVDTSGADELETFEELLAQTKAKRR